MQYKRACDGEVSIPEAGKRSNCTVKVNLDQGATDQLLSLVVKTRNGVGVAKGSTLYLDASLVDVACGGSAWKRMKMDFFKPIAATESESSKAATGEAETPKADTAGSSPGEPAPTPAAPVPPVPLPKPADEKGETKPPPPSQSSRQAVRRSAAA